MACHTSIRWGDMVLIGVYLPPSLNIRQFEEALEEMEELIQQMDNTPMFVLGDFNAKDIMWQSKTTDLRGKTVAEWASRLGLCCLNHGGKSTCVRYSGESIVDLTFATPVAARRLFSWKVSDRESRSDHMYIEIEIRKTRMQKTKERSPQTKRWAVKKLDKDMLSAAIIASCWTKHYMTEEDIGEDIEGTADRVQSIMIEACNIAMPRSEAKMRKAVPWWSTELDQLRSELSATRRRLRRARRRRNALNEEETEVKLNEFRQARDTFSKVIRKAKARA
ncbi:PREDICTED: uncharacterized protein LOC108763666 [Trachymyrmex cornetzi]|uniref:uncharacterized protein LOC108763666 n=1 Tax=Trachymyrmex cornetzi TaxID=471704 RepID=UPI00084F2770|nr:PREDICTED: uncharacterized protein LOC108763666 [Trachymyrmex cornetzi]